MNVQTEVARQPAGGGVSGLYQFYRPRELGSLPKATPTAQIQTVASLD
jgi:hypothetical protein